MRRVNLIPMAGLGERFINKGYKIPKPLILIKKKPMFVRAAMSLPKSDLLIFICLKEHVKTFKINKVIKSFFPKSKIIISKKKKIGQAADCYEAAKYLKKKDLLTIGSCDCAMIYNSNLLRKKIKNADLIVWTFKDKKIVKKNPTMYGYVKVDKNSVIKKISCKKKISKFPWKDHAIIGAFTFKRAEIFLKYTKELLLSNNKVNNEYYMDTVAENCVNSGIKAKVNLVKKYCGWGTPADLENFLIK
jgi:bifunctional N-acetylglucosamine-1-phosphate-uridyltransferase/glucosamine-1-phosphate-acetyltransferase GlmU-like protein